MKQPPKCLWLSLVLAGLAGYALYTAQARRTASLAQLAHLETCLAASNERVAQANASSLHMIGWYVCRNRNQANDVAVLRQSQQIQARTQALADTLRHLRQQLHTEHPAGKAWQHLPALLHAYTFYIQKFIPEYAPPAHLTQAGELAGGLGLFSQKATPSAVATASLTCLENQVWHYGATALQNQAAKVGESGDYFSITRPVVIPASQTVLPGGTYEAWLVVAGWLHHPYCSEQFYADAAELRAHGEWGDSRRLTLPIPPARPGQPDTVQAQWTGTIRAAGYTSDTVLTVRIPYFVVKRPAL